MTLRKRMEVEALERQRLQIALEKERELRELKNRFLSMMSHELRTPLASIRLSYDMLHKYGTVSTEEERQQALDNIHTQVGYLADMVTDVSTLSRSESKGFAPMLEDTDLITYCRDVVEEFQFNYIRTHQIEFECDERVLRVPIDRKLLRRALTNLLSNAIKYSPQGGFVGFTLARHGKSAVIKVSDNGIGIPPEDHAHLFEPFHRARNASTIPGTGLGLPITRQAVELHGGSISFVTGSSGTTFTIRLPLYHD
jgi:signal transduction histidine kinase